MHNVGSDHPPALLIHGDTDDDVPVGESIAMAAALDAAGVRDELRIEEGAGHGFDLAADDPRATAAMDAAIDFLGEALA